MGARRGPLFLGCAALVLGGAGCGRSEPAPLVLLILVDTLRLDALSCYGGERPTPAIDALAAEGVRFEQAIASSGWTLPSAASILTGVSPPVHHARGKKTRLTPISPDLPTGAELLSAAGVRTIAFTNAAFVNPLLGLTRGFELQSHHHAYNDEIRRADATIDEALAALAAEDDRPTFCLIHLFDPHIDYDPPGEYAQRYTEGLVDKKRPLSFEDCSSLPPGRTGERPSPDHVARVRAAYDAEIAFVDAEIGRLVAELERRGRLGRTSIFVTADHGEEFWEHGGFEHGHTLYDELIHVPLVLRSFEEHAVRAGVPRAGVISAQVRSIDILPTVFELLGVPPSAGFEGRSLLPLLRGEEREPRPAFSDGTLYGRDKTALRTGDHKLVLERERDGNDSLELFDLRADPGETRDLAAQDPALAERLRLELETWLAELERRAEKNRAGELQDLSPGKKEEYLRQLSSLGYAEDDG